MERYKTKQRLTTTVYEIVQAVSESSGQNDEVTVEVVKHLINTGRIKLLKAQPDRACVEFNKAC